MKAALFVLILTLGCETPGADLVALGSRVATWQPDSASTLAHLYYSGALDARRLVVANGMTWAQTWAQIYSTYSPEPGAPAVDFGAYRVLVAALGQHATGGFDIRIDSVVQFEQGSVAYVTTIAPGSTCITTQALSQPVHMVRVPADLAQDLQFESQAVVRDCS